MTKIVTVTPKVVEHIAFQFNEETVELPKDFPGEIRAHKNTRRIVMIVSERECFFKLKYWFIKVTPTAWRTCSNETFHRLYDIKSNDAVVHVRLSNDEIAYASASDEEKRAWGKFLPTTEEHESFPKGFSRWLEDYQKYPGIVEDTIAFRSTNSIVRRQFLEFNKRADPLEEMPESFGFRFWSHSANCKQKTAY